MTSVLNYLNSSSTNPSLGSGANVNRPTTFIIQPAAQVETLLTKRHKTTELGDLLMKKIKTRTSSENNSNQQSPNHKENFEDVYDGLESRSMIEEGNSPSNKSNNGGDGEKNNVSLFAQRSVSTPLAFGSLGLGLGLPRLGSHSNQKQVQNALEALQRKLLLEQQTASLREMIQKAKLAHAPLTIPPLKSTSNSTASSLKKEKMQEVKTAPKNDEEEPEVMIGEVEYPLLALANPLFGSNTAQKSQRLIEAPSFESLTATRAETQRSDSDTNEDLSESADGKKKRNKKGTNTEKAKKTQKKEKEQGKEKSKAKKQNVDLLSPVLTAKKKRMTERKPNKWQLNTDVEQNNNDSKKVFESVGAQ